MGYSVREGVNFIEWKVTECIHIHNLSFEVILNKVKNRWFARDMRFVALDSSLRQNGKTILRHSLFKQVGGERVIGITAENRAQKFSRGAVFAQAKTALGFEK